MSSESEDDFLSADEGSDFEDSVPVVTHDLARNKVTPISLDCTDLESGEDTCKDGIYEPKTVVSANISKVTSAETLHSKEATKESLLHESDEDESVTHITTKFKAINVQEEPGNIVLAATEFESYHTKHEGHLGSADEAAKELSHPLLEEKQEEEEMKSEMREEKLEAENGIEDTGKRTCVLGGGQSLIESRISEQREISNNWNKLADSSENKKQSEFSEHREAEKAALGEPITKNVKLKESDLPRVDSKDVTEKSEKIISNKAESWKKPEDEASKVEKDDSLIEQPKPKPIRESKIGKKKPREKLGERLGVRKLGARVDKPMHSISSESISKDADLPVKTDSNTKTSALDTHKDNFSKEQRVHQSEDKISDSMRQQESHREVGMKTSSSSQWDQEQQQRWQKATQQEKNDQVTSSSRDDEGWGGSWGGWGSTLLSAASTFTQEVGRGVGSVIETVEGGLGVPDPETLAKEIAEREKLWKSMEADSDIGANQDDQESEANCTDVNQSGESRKTDGGLENEKSSQNFGLGGLSSLGSFVSGVSGVFETASTKVLVGGLDTLEVIGRKAMNVIQEGDPGLRRKRAFLANRKPNLSLVLQEARQRAAEEERTSKEQGNKPSASERHTFAEAWEGTAGPVHLEALSLVAKQCETKMSTRIQALPHYLLSKIQDANNEIKVMCELDEENVAEEDFAVQVNDIMALLDLPLSAEKLIQARTSIEDTAALIQEAGLVDGPSVERELYAALAVLVMQFAALTHKGAELALITQEADPLSVVTHFRELSTLVCGGIETTADQVCGAVTSGISAADPQMNNMITNIYLQAASGNSYVQQSMTFLSSVVQYANTKRIAAEL